MTIEGPEPTAPAAAPVKKMNVFERIAGALFDPAETFDDVARRPDVLAPLAIFVVIGIILTAVMMPRFDYDALSAQQAEKMRKRNPNVTDADLAQMERLTRASTKVVSWIIPVATVCWYALVAGVLLLAFRLFGGDGNYAQAFSATLYAWIPLLLFSIISGIVTLAQGTFNPVTAATQVKSNPAFLVDMKEHPVLFSLASSFDVFTIWTIVLLIFGFAALARTTRAKAATIVLSLWLAMLVVKLGFVALTA